MAKTQSEISIESRNKLYDRQEVLFLREGDERGQVKAMAKAVGMSANEYCRMAVLERLKRDQERLDREILKWEIVKMDLPVLKTEKYSKGQAFTAAPIEEATVVSRFDSKKDAEAAFKDMIVTKQSLPPRYTLYSDYALVEKSVDKATGKATRDPRILKYAKTK